MRGNDFLARAKTTYGRAALSSDDARKTDRPLPRRYLRIHF